jgi:uncharacterized protein
MTRARLGVWVPLTLACCGCASAPVSYYTLIPQPASANVATDDACCVIEIRNVRIPAQADRPELVVRRSEQQFDILGNDLWIAPLRDEVRGALLDDIRGKLPQRRPGEKARKFTLFVDVTRFESRAANYALIEAAWRVERAADPQPAAPVCKALARVSIADGVSGLVRGYQQALSTLASSMTVTVLALQQGAAAECPAPPPAG